MSGHVYGSETAGVQTAGHARRCFQNPDLLTFDGRYLDHFQLGSFRVYANSNSSCKQTTCLFYERYLIWNIPLLLSLSKQAFSKLKSLIQKVNVFFGASLLSIFPFTLFVIEFINPCRYNWSMGIRELSRSFLICRRRGIWSLHFVSQLILDGPLLKYEKHNTQMEDLQSPSASNFRFGFADTQDC